MDLDTQKLFFNSQSDVETKRRYGSLAEELREFNQFGKRTIVEQTEAPSPNGDTISIDTYISEFWTSKQRAANSLHEISYRACFKPQLPRFFIERLTRPGDVVYDPFMGRGTTCLEAALMGRVPFGCDINPLSSALVAPRLDPPRLDDIAHRLGEIDFHEPDDAPEELLVFYHPETLWEISALRRYLLERERNGALDAVDGWIRMVALNRLTGHSPGFFSVYTLPPNQAVSVESQRKINRDRDQTPPLRDVPRLIVRKSKSLLADCGRVACETLSKTAGRALLLTGQSHNTPEIAGGSVALVVTSPPFLNVVNYRQDNWLRCWFCGVDPDGVEITMASKLDDWRRAMTDVFRELERVLAPGGHVAFEVGEVRAGRVRLEEETVPCAMAAGLQPELILINDQKFTKTAQCWGVSNNRKGTNTNRIVLLGKG